MMKRSHSFYRRPAAFTIIELVVAMAIATIMIFLINRIFFDTTNAVSKGMGLSQIIGESRAISSTLTTDFIPGNTIALPTDQGFLFIGFRQYTNVEFPSPQRLGSQFQRDVTSDQLLLVMKNMNNRYPLTPQDETTYSPYNASANHGLLWYGHVARLNPDGSYAPGLGAAPNQFGHNWIVGRQLSFLAGPSITTVLGLAYADDVYANSAVANYTLPAGVPAVRFMGLTDIIARDISYLTAPLASATPGVLSNETIEQQYLGHVARLAYVTEDSSANPVHRLRVATGVAQNTVTPTDSFKSWNVAQTHPAFMTNCSDFQVSFAGDFDGDVLNEIDTEPSAAAGTDVNGVGYPAYTGGGIMWYGYPANEPGTAGYDSTKPALYPPDTTAVFSTAAAGKPVHSVGGVTLSGHINLTTPAPAVPTTTTLVDHAVVFRHDAAAPETQWPHMIRIRYRLHDERGEIESTTGSARTQGIWFEQIIRIQ